MRVVCIDLSSPYRALVRHWFPNARIVADRFHVIRILLHHFMDLVREIVPQIGHHRGYLAIPRDSTQPNSLDWKNSWPTIPRWFRSIKK